MSEDICAICLENCDECLKTHCNHPFHLDCLRISMLTNNKCPVCRRKLNFSDEVAFTEPNFQLMGTTGKYYIRYYTIHQKKLFYCKNGNNFELVGKSTPDGGIIVENSDEGRDFYDFLWSYSLWSY